MSLTHLKAGEYTSLFCGDSEIGISIGVCAFCKSSYLECDDLDFEKYPNCNCKCGQRVKQFVVSQEDNHRRFCKDLLEKQEHFTEKE